jgi:deazaflavin-dependent oxidoreductase (nitroreductase family)
MAALRRVDPTVARSWFTRAFARVGATRGAFFVSRHVNWKVDPWLLRVTGGRLRTGLTIPMALLETTGAKTGLPRRRAVIYFHDGELVTIVASQGGLPSNPDWFHNVVAHPDVTLNGIPMRARVVVDHAEQARLWPLADRVFPPFVDYRRRAEEAGRAIPLIQLAPVLT